MQKLNLDTLKTLSTLVGISGGEEAVVDAIEAMVAPYADELRRTPLGDLLVFKKGEKTPEKTLMICAHTDEVGLIVTDIDSSGYLRFTAVGGVESSVLLGKTVYVNGTTRGGIGGKPVHLMRGDEREKEVPIRELTIDIGAQSKEEAEAVVSVGDYVNFEPFFQVNGDTVMGKALDDRMGCAILVDLIQGGDMPYDTWFAFTTREEVGSVGASAAAYEIDPDLVIAVEGTVAGDVLGTPSPKNCTRLGKGAAVSFVDRGTVYDREFFKAAFDLARELDIPCQPRTNNAGRNDASAVQKSRGGARAAAISVPCRYIHSPVSMAKISDADGALNLVRALAGRMLEG
ncbi:MAG: M42 family peptidase [Clostridia bacterium]|nr:M42 family peptidase [Clostridia bacterium]